MAQALALVQVLVEVAVVGRQVVRQQVLVVLLGPDSAGPWGAARSTMAPNKTKSVAAETTFVLRILYAMRSYWRSY